MKTFIIAGATEERCVCVYCKDKDGQPLEIFVDNVETHILSKKHEKATPMGERKKGASLDKLKEKIKAKSVKLERNQSKKNKDEEANQHFLEFIAFAIAENYSFSQIERLGNFLQSFYKKNQLHFLKSSKFQREFISEVCQSCFRPVLLDHIHEELSKILYSFSIDNTTLGGENFCGIKVKYLTKDEMGKAKVNDKFLGLTKLEEKSNGETMRKIVQEKLFWSSTIKRNLLGMTHDRGSSIVGGNVGLISLLEEDIQSKISSLPDPCHSLNLVIKNSLDCLSEEIRSFIADIHTHFLSPQKKAKLRRIQQENNLPVLNPKKYVKVRWLSLGLSLERLIKIWDALKLYIDQIKRPKERKLRKGRKRRKGKNNGELKSIDVNKFDALLNSPLFASEIRFLSFITTKINFYNQKFQNPYLEPQKVGEISQEAFYFFANLVVLPCILDLSKESLLGFDWEDEEIYKDHCLGVEEFIENLVFSFPEELSTLKNLTSMEKDEFCGIFLPFLRRILNLMIFYLPLEEEVMNNLAFVEMRGPFSIFKNQMLQFNKRFNIIKEDQLSALTSEFNQLQAKTLNYFHQINDNNSILALWDIVEDHGYVLIPLIAKAAMILPTSSSNIEQLFSIFKQVKTLIRNSLNTDNLEAILLLSQEYKERNSRIITQELLHLFNSLKFKEPTTQVISINQIQNNEGKMEEKERIADQLMEVIDEVIPEIQNNDIFVEKHQKSKT